MKKIGLLVVAMLMSLVGYAQQDVTTFLGIPVDGTKKEMMKKLKEKEFVPVPYLGDDAMMGEFNGRKVYVFVVTNRNKVWRIAVRDIAPMDESEVKSRFNELCRQFKGNRKYLALPDSLQSYEISPEEDIAYEMQVHDKLYGAGFYQQALPVDTVTIIEELKPYFSSHDIDISDSTKSNKVLINSTIKMYMLQATLKKLVMIQISKDSFASNKYTIWYYYDNEYNEANGEDL